MLQKVLSLLETQDAKQLSVITLTSATKICTSVPLVGHDFLISGWNYPIFLSSKQGQHVFRAEVGHTKKR